MRGEGEGQAEIGRELRAEGARAEDPDRHLQPGARHRLYLLTRLGRLEIAHQLDDVLREPVGITQQGSAHRPGGDLVGTRRAAEAQLDPPRMQRRQGAELFGDQ